MSNPTNIKVEVPNINTNVKSNFTPANNQGITNIKSEDVNIEEVTFSPEEIPNKGSISSLNLARIALSSDRAKSGDFVSEDKIDKNFWDVKRLTYEKNEFGSYTLFRDGKPVGYTDEAGLTGITPIKEEVEVKPEVEQTNTTVNDDNSTNVESISAKTSYNGDVLTRQAGTIEGPSGRETYYNLDMTKVVANMRKIGYDETNYPYWVREDGVKMLGNYAILSANQNIRPIGTILPTSLGEGIVCDTGGFIEQYPNGVDIATIW